MIVAQISDTHIVHGVPDAEQRVADLERTIADINALDPPPDAIIHTGDVTHGGRPEDYALVAALFRTARAPVYVAPGNRDHREHLRAAFAGGPCRATGTPFLDYSIEDFPVRLIAVDTVATASNKGDFCAERVDRLIARIDADRARPIVAFMHHPPFVVTVGPDPLNFTSPEAMHRLQQALQHSERVIGVFCGHVHRSTGGWIGAIRVMVVPSTATTLRKGDYPHPLRDRPIYYLHRYDPAFGFSTETRIVAMSAAERAAADGARSGASGPAGLERRRDPAEHGLER